MGVHGLWKLIEPSGQMVPLESLAGKVLAVDISIWLHQAVKGMHDAQGAPMAVAHLLILFHRLCKLLFYKIKPVFVFDGGVPLLKTQTMAARRQRSSAAKTEAMKVREKLIKNLLKHEAVRQVLSNETASAALGLNSFTLPGPSIEEDLYKLPPIAADYVDSECSEEDISADDEESEKHTQDIHSIDVTSQEFLRLPAEVRHDILTELIETRKQSSWKYLDMMPKQSDNFSDFQMSRLLKRHAVQTSLEKAGKEMGGRALSLKELETLLGDQGVLDPKIDLPSRRIAQDSTTRYMLVQKDGELPSGKFDVMEHLEDVEWSSESDTDIILEKGKREVVVSKNKEEKKENLVFEPKIQMTKEAADILSILEGKDAADEKVKVKDLSDLNVNLTLCESKSELQSNANVIKTAKNLFFSQDDCNSSNSKAPGENHAKDCNTIVPIANVETVKEELEEQKIKDVSHSFSDSENDKLVEKTEAKGETVNKKELESKIGQEAIFLSDSESNKIIETRNDKTVAKVEEELEGKLKQITESPLSLADLKAVDKTALEVETVDKVQFKNKEDVIAHFCSDTDSQKVVGGRNVKTVEEAETLSDLQNKRSIEVLKINKKPESKFKQTVDFSSISENKEMNEKNVIEIETDNEKKPTSEIGDIADSSSDSENEFIAINSSEMENNLSRATAKAVPQTPSTASETDSLTVVINPSEVSQNDDLFADVFEPSKAKENEDERKDEFKGIESVEEFSKALEQEHSHLIQEKGKQERHALNLTDQIYTDAQELLRLFGVPFVVAPMEAEAQCATLNALGLTEGTITDDSDIWLFGGRVVYKNFFNQNKHVLEYRMENIERNFKLTREEMIKMALLVGSDYTVGLSGIGPVTALEIIASFQSPNRGMIDSLHKFRDWYLGTAKSGPSRITLRKKIKNIVMTPGFPSRAVIEAYLHPIVDDSTERFSWAKPSLDLIQKYVRSKMGWSKEKCNDLLQPVMKKLEEKNSQFTIEKHFKFVQKSGITDGTLSKRVESAIKLLGNSSVESDEPASEPKPKRKRKQENANSSKKHSTDEDSKKSVKKQKTSDSVKNEVEKFKIITARLHQNVKVPQKEMAQKALEEKKKEAIKIFRTYGKRGKKKRKVFAKEEANLSESSNDD